MAHWFAFISFFLTLSPHLALALSIFLVDCGLGLDPRNPSGAEVYEIYLYNNANNALAHPNQIVVFPKVNGYPWNVRGTPVDFPDGTAWSFVVDDKIPNYDYAGYAIHRGVSGKILEVLYCFADRGVEIGLDHSGSGDQCITRFLCREQGPDIPLPPPETAAPTSQPTDGVTSSSATSTFSTSSTPSGTGPSTPPGTGTFGPTNPSTGLYPTGTGPSTLPGTGTGSGISPTGTGFAQLSADISPRSNALDLTIEVHPRQVRVERIWTSIIQQASVDIWGNCPANARSLTDKTKISYQCLGSEIREFDRKTIVPILLDTLYRLGQEKTWIEEKNGFTILPMSMSLTVTDGSRQASIKYNLISEKFEFIGARCVACNESMFTDRWDGAAVRAFSPQLSQEVTVLKSCLPNEHCVSSPKVEVEPKEGSSIWW